MLLDERNFLRLVILINDHLRNARHKVHIRIFEHFDSAVIGVYCASSRSKNK